MLDLRNAAANNRAAARRHLRLTLKAHAALEEYRWVVDTTTNAAIIASAHAALVAAEARRDAAKVKRAAARQIYRDMRYASMGESRPAPSSSDVGDHLVLALAKVHGQPGNV